MNSVEETLPTPSRSCIREISRVLTKGARTAATRCGGRVIRTAVKMEPAEKPVTRGIKRDATCGPPSDTKASIVNEKSGSLLSSATLQPCARQNVLHNREIPACFSMKCCQS